MSQHFCCDGISLIQDYKRIHELLCTFVPLIYFSSFYFCVARARAIVRIKKTNSRIENNVHGQAISVQFELIMFL